MSETTEKIVLGVCPICGNGKMVKGTLGYSCDYFKSMDDKCGFNIYKSYFEKEITEEIALQLIEKGETEIFSDLKKKDGTLFRASFKIEERKVKPQFKNNILDVPCPICGKQVEELLTGFACEDYSKKDASEKRVCNIFIPKVIAGREIPQPAAEALLRGEQTQTMVGFKNRDGEKFSSRLVLTQDLNVAFSNNLCSCPKCGSGLIYVGKKAYNCSNYKNEAIKCDFTIWKEMSGRLITEDEVIQLCQNKETDVLTGFMNDGVPFERKLVLNDDFKVKLV